MPGNYQPDWTCTKDVFVCRNGELMEFLQDDRGPSYPIQLRPIGNQTLSRWYYRDGSSNIRSEFDVVSQNFLLTFDQLVRLVPESAGYTVAQRNNLAAVINDETSEELLSPTLPQLRELLGAAYNVVELPLAHNPQELHKLCNSIAKRFYDMYLPTTSRDCEASLAGIIQLNVESYLRRRGIN